MMHQMETCLMTFLLIHMEMNQYEQIMKNAFNYYLSIKELLKCKNNSFMPQYFMHAIKSEIINF